MPVVKIMTRAVDGAACQGSALSRFGRFQTRFLWDSYKSDLRIISKNYGRSGISAAVTLPAAQSERRRRRIVAPQL